MDGNRLYSKRTQLPIDVDWIRTASLESLDPYADDPNGIRIILLKGNVFTFTEDSLDYFEIYKQCHTIFDNTLDMFQLHDNVLLGLMETTLIAYIIRKTGRESVTPVYVQHLQSGEKAFSFKKIAKRKGNN